MYPCRFDHGASAVFKSRYPANDGGFEHTVNTETGDNPLGRITTEQKKIFQGALKGTRVLANLETKQKSPGHLPRAATRTARLGKELNLSCTAESGVSFTSWLTGAIFKLACDQITTASLKKKIIVKLSFTQK